MSTCQPDGGGPASIPLQDPAREYRELREELDEAVRRVMEDGRYVLGPAVEAFEEAVAERLGAAYAMGVASGTDALVLALRALGVGEGDEVVTSPFSFVATAEAILRAGAEPVFADVRPDTLNLDPEAAADAVTPRTAALLPVHLYGQMADVRELRGLAERHGLALVEDAAQALGAAQRPSGPGDRGAAAGEGWRPAGTAGDAGCFSFYPVKSLGGMGDGGMVVTDDEEVARRLRRLRDHGRDPEAGHEDRGLHREVAYNSRLDALQAAVLRVKLGRLEAWNDRRRRHARAYDRALEDHDSVEPPPVRPGNRHVYTQYTVRCRDREAVRTALRRAGIGHGVYYPVPLHLQPPLRRFGGGPGSFPVAERAAGEVLSLPVFPTLTEEERDRVADALAGL